MDVLDDHARGGFLFIELGPLLNPQGKGLILPGEEAYRIHYSGLDNLSSWEDAPGDSIGLQIWSIGDILTLDIDYVVVHSQLILLEHFEQCCDNFTGGEEL